LTLHLGFGVCCLVTHRALQGTGHFICGIFYSIINETRVGYFMNSVNCSFYKCQNYATPSAHFQALNHFRPQPFYCRGDNRIEGVRGPKVGIKGHEFYIKGLKLFLPFFM
jgi:hypothetical protein